MTVEVAGLSGSNRSSLPALIQNGSRIQRGPATLRALVLRATTALRMSFRFHFHFHRSWFYHFPTLLPPSVQVSMDATVTVTIHGPSMDGHLDYSFLSKYLLCLPIDYPRMC